MYWKEHWFATKNAMAASNWTVLLFIVKVCLIGSGCDTLRMNSGYSLTVPETLVVGQTSNGELSSWNSYVACPPSALYCDRSSLSRPFYNSDIQLWEAGRFVGDDCLHRGSKISLQTVQWLSDVLFPLGLGCLGQLPFWGMVWLGIIIENHLSPNNVNWTSGGPGEGQGTNAPSAEFMVSRKYCLRLQGSLRTLFQCCVMLHGAR